MIDALPSVSRRWGPALVVAAGAAYVVVAAWAGVPVSVDSVGRLLMFALPIAGIYAVNATGLVVVYSGTGIFNLAQGSIGMIGAYIYWELRVAHGMAELPALLITVFGVAPVMGFLLDALLMRKLASASLIAKLVGTLGLSVTLIGVANLIWNPDTAHAIPPLVAGRGGIHAFGVVLPWHRVLTIGAALALALFLRWMLFRTRVGIAMRAVVDNTDLATLYGVRQARMSSTAWIIGSVCATVASILIAPELGNLSAQTLSLLIIDAFAAAVIGRLRSLPMTYLGAMILGLIVAFSSTFLHFGGRWAQLPGAVPSIALLAVLLLMPARNVELGRPLRTFRIESVPSFRTAAGAGVLAIAVSVILGSTVSVQSLAALGVGVATGIILLGLVPLVGWAGQPFLAPYALAGFGAWLAWRLEGDVPELLLILLAGLLTAAVGVLTAIPALRLRGLYSALASLAVANIAVDVIFPQPGMMESDQQVKRISLFGMSLNGARGILIFAVAVYVVLALAVVALRRSRIGRQLVASRDSEAGAAGVGVRLAGTTAVVFAIAGFITGIGGAILVQVQQFMSVDLFPMIGGLSILLSLVVFGIGTASGPLLAGFSIAMTTIVNTFWLHGRWGAALASIGPALAALGLIRFPRGSVPEVVADARTNPAVVAGRIVGLAAGATLGIELHLPGLAGLLLALVGAFAAGIVVQLVQEWRSGALDALHPGRVHPGLVDLDDPLLGLTHQLDGAIRARLDSALNLGTGSRI